MLSILFLLQRQKQKQPVNRSAVSLGSLTSFPTHFFTASTFPPQGPGPSLPPACLPGPPLPKPPAPLILSEVSPTRGSRLVVCKDGAGWRSGLPHGPLGCDSDCNHRRILFRFVFGRRASCVYLLCHHPLRHSLCTLYTTAGHPERSKMRPWPLIAWGVDKLLDRVKCSIQCLVRLTKCNQAL